MCERRWKRHARVTSDRWWSGVSQHRTRRTNTLLGFYRELVRWCRKRRQRGWAQTARDLADELSGIPALRACR